MGARKSRPLGRGTDRKRDAGLNAPATTTANPVVKNTTGNLSNPELKDGEKNLFGASAAVQTYVVAILQQADMKLDEMPDLPEHQKVARQHAESWNQTVLPGIIQTNANIIDFANQFKAYYTTLVKIADNVASDPKAREEFIQGLTLLRNNVSDKAHGAKKVGTSLKGFKDNLMVDYKAFTDDAAKATKIYEGKSGEIASLSSQIDTAQGKLDTYIGVMSGGAVGIAAGIVVICVGAFAEIETAPLSTGLIVAGTGLLAGGITSGITGSVEYALEVKKLTELKEKLAEDKEGLMAVKTVKGQLDGLVSQLGNATAAVDILIRQWADLDTSLGKVITDVSNDPGTYGPELKAMLDRARQDWEEALDLALRIQPTGQLPVISVKNIQDVIHTHG